VTVVFALAASLAYGLSDFVGGIVSRRVSPWAVAAVGTAVATVCTAAVAAVAGGSPSAGHLAWGMAAGIGNALGTAMLYRGLGAGRMGVVAPLSAVGAALLPVVVGVATGERPSMATWVGVAVAFPAIWLIARGTEQDEVLGLPQPDCRPRSQDVIDGLLAGAGFGVLFVGLGQVPEGAGLLPLTIAQGVAAAILFVVVAVRSDILLPRGRDAAQATIPGLLGATATVLFVLATHSGLLAVASVLTSLYPAATVVLAAVILHEHIARWQGIGLGLAGVAVGLVAAG
jgi:drug/metabolite transporter (DMT)-like permease